MRSRWLAIGTIAGCLMLPAIGQGGDTAAEDQYLFATELFGKKIYGLAIQQYEKFLKEHPRHGKEFQARLRIGEAYLRLKQYDRSVAAYESALATKPDTTFRGEALVGLGVALYHGKEYAKSGETLAQAQPLVGEDKTLGPIAANWLGEALFNQGRYADAARAYESVSRWPESEHAPQALYSLGFCQLKQNQAEAAIGTFQKLAKEYPKSSLASESLLRAGELLQKQGKHAEADALFTNASKEGSEGESGAEGAWALAWSAYQQKKYAEARAQFETFASRHPKSPRAAEAPIRVGDCYYREGQYPAAATAYERAATTLQGDAAREARYWLAMARWKADDPENALVTFRELAPDGSKDTFAQRSRLRQGELEAARGNTDAALRAYRACVDTDPRSSQAEAAAYAAAALAYRIRRYEEAERGFSEFVAAYPKSAQAPTARLAQAQCRFERRDYTGARTLLLSLLGSSGSAPGAPSAQSPAPEPAAAPLPDSQAPSAGEATPLLKGETRGDALLLLGRCHARLKENDTAIRVWTQLTEELPTSAAAPRALAAIAELHEAAGRTAEAERSLALLAEKYPRSTAAAGSLVRAGDTERAAGRFDAAIERYRKALGGEPSPTIAANARLGIAAALLRLEKPEAALAECRVLLETPPTPVIADQARLLMGSAHEKQGKRDEAMAIYRAMIARKDAPTSSLPLAMLRLGRLQSDTRQYPDARATFDRLLKEHPTSPWVPDALYEFGWAASEAGDGAAARGAWERLAKEHPRHSLAADAAFRLAEDDYAAKRHDAAIKYYRLVVASKDAAELADKAWYKLGWCYRQQGQPARAAAAFAKVWTSFPQSELATESRLYAGEAFAAQNDWSAAREQFTQVIKLGMKSPESTPVVRARLGLGRARIAAGDVAGGVTELRPIARTVNGATGAEAQFLIGEAYLALRDYARAVEEHLRVTLLYPAHRNWAAQSQYQVGEAYRLQGNTREAQAAYRKCAHTYPGTRWAQLRSQRLGTTLGAGRGGKETRRQGDGEHESSRAGARTSDLSDSIRSDRSVRARS